jgi:hypothetical protein
MTEKSQRSVEIVGGDGADRSATASGTERLAAATRRLSATIAATEILAQERAALLRSSGYLGGPGPAGRVVSLREAATAAGRHPEVLRRWCSEGRLPAIRVGRTWAISGETLATLIAHRNRARPRFPMDDSSG